MIFIDGRIDCAMTSKLPGVDDYYTTLEEIKVPTTVNGRVTAELEMAEVTCQLCLTDLRRSTM